MGALTALVADFSGDGDGLGVVRDGFVVLALGVVDDCRDCRDGCPQRACHRFLRWRGPLVRDGGVMALPGQRKTARASLAQKISSAAVALPSIGISALLRLNPSQLQQPLGLNQRQLLLFRLKPLPTVPPPPPSGSTLPQQRRQRRHRLAQLAVVSSPSALQPSPAPAPAPLGRPRHRRPDGRHGPSCRGTWHALRGGTLPGARRPRAGPGLHRIWPCWARRRAREPRKAPAAARRHLVTDGDGLAEGRLGFIESVELDERFAEIAEMDAFTSACHRFLGDGEGLGVVR